MRLPPVMWCERCQVSVGLSVSPLKGAGRLRCAPEPLSKALRLARDGVPSCTQHGQAEEPAEARGGPFPCPGTAGPDFFTLRVNEARLAN